MPVAVNCCVVPTGAEELDGVTDIDKRAGVTERVTELAIAPTFALIVLTPWARPLVSPVAVTVATFLLDDVHVTEVVKFCVVPLL